MPTTQEQRQKKQSPKRRYSQVQQESEPVEPGYHKASKTRIKKPTDKERAQKLISETRAVLDLARIDHQRALVSGVGKLTQVEMASAARVSQPSISEALERARSVVEPRKGFTSATLHEMFLRYTAKKLSKKKLIQELSLWEYDEPDIADSIDGLLVDSPNSFREVESALIQGLIEPDVYNEVLSRLRKKD